MRRVDPLQADRRDQLADVSQPRPHVGRQRVESPRLWAMYAWLGKAEARYALERHPEFIHEIAQPALLNAPEAAIPMLLAAIVDDGGRSGQSTADSSIDHLEKWIKGIPSDREHVIERRRTLVSETVAWWKTTRNGEHAVRALCLALIPGFDYSALDPGIGKTVSYWSEMLDDDDLRAIVDLEGSRLFSARCPARNPRSNKVLGGAGERDVGGRATRIRGAAERR